MADFGEYRHFHSSVGVMTPCMSSSTQDTERLWRPPPQEVEQAVQGLLSHLEGLNSERSERAGRHGRQKNVSAHTEAGGGTGRTA